MKQQSHEENNQANNETFRISCFQSRNATQEFRNILDKTDETNDLISWLNNNQKRAFEIIINIIINSDSKCFRLYLSNEGGTGKSYFI